MSQEAKAIRQFPDWILTEKFIEGATEAQMLNEELSWKEPEDFVGAYVFEEGYALSAPNTDGSYIYSDVTFSQEETR